MLLDEFASAFASAGRCCLRRIIDSVGLARSADMRRRIFGVGILQRVQIGEVQPRRLFDVAHQRVHDGRIGILVQTDQRLRSKLLFHLVERALRDDRANLPGRGSSPSALASSLVACLGRGKHSARSVR